MKVRRNWKGQAAYRLVVAFTALHMGFLPFPGLLHYLSYHSPPRLPQAHLGALASEAVSGALTGQHQGEAPPETGNHKCGICLAWSASSEAKPQAVAHPIPPVATPAITVPPEVYEVTPELFLALPRNKSPPLHA